MIGDGKGVWVVVRGGSGCGRIPGLSLRGRWMIFNNRFKMDTEVTVESGALRRGTRCPVASVAFYYQFCLTEIQHPFRTPYMSCWKALRDCL